MNSRLDKSSPLSWTQFSEVFLEKYMPQNLRDCLRDQFSRLGQVSMIIAEYEASFHELSSMQLLFWVLSMTKFVALLEAREFR